ncbi:hypothetical protein [Pseudomonas atacamensis]|uniref:hypothetical protein n=1 Tax=Pseudomonas atacamensis TaxID=2565368 RepID=UPI00300F5981
MTEDELREVETARRKAIWALASLRPGDPNALPHLSILNNLHSQERNSRPSMDNTLELKKVRESVQVRPHHTGMDIVLEFYIPQPWRERFRQASTGSTRLMDGLFAADWDKFLNEWESEMLHLQSHRAAQMRDN